MARKTYTRAFKLQALRMLTDQGLSVAEVARLLGVGENCLRNWRQAAREQARPPSPARATPPRPRTSSAASGPRSSASAPRGTC
jgi:transposase-like protein